MNDEVKQGLDFYQDSKNEWRWRVVAPNGEVIGVSSEGYDDIRDAHYGAGLTLSILAESAGNLLAQNAGAKDDA